MKYAWIVDSDPATEPTDDLYRVGTVGPRTAPDDLMARLRAGAGYPWRTKYENGEDPEHHDIVHAGRILFADEVYIGGFDDGLELPEEAFGPLDDLSRPDCGAVTIEYEINGKWVVL